MEKQKLSKYQIYSKLGEGATAEVFHAYDTVLGRDVALKVLKPALVPDTSAFERFIQEAQAAARLFHPHIATVLDMGDADGRYFIVMRYVPGRSLDLILKENGSLPWDEALKMVTQIGEALDHAHKEGYMHRDVKPSNIIRDGKGDFWLTDFGLTRAMMSTGLTSHTGAVLGTPPYIAPEIWNGAQPTSASDQYALACILYEVVTGEMLFYGETPQEIITKHLIKGPEFTGAWPEGTPEGFEVVLYQALVADPGDRVDNGRTFAGTLRKLETPDQRDERLAAEKRAREAEDARVSEIDGRKLTLEAEEEERKPVDVEPETQKGKPKDLEGESSKEGESATFVYPEATPPKNAFIRGLDQFQQMISMLDDKSMSNWKPITWIVIGCLIGGILNAVVWYFTIWLLEGAWIFYLSTMVIEGGILGSVLVFVGRGLHYVSSKKNMRDMVLAWMGGSAIGGLISSVGFLGIFDIFNGMFFSPWTYIGVTAGGLGGWVTAYVLKKENALSKWKSVRIVFFGWMISGFLSGTIGGFITEYIQDEFGFFFLVSFIKISINTSIGSIITFWRIILDKTQPNLKTTT